MPLQNARKASDTVSYRVNDHRSENLKVLAAAPATPAGVVATPGAAGTLANATYIYRVTSVRDGLESAPSAQVSAIVVAGGTGSVSLVWVAVPGATSYRVYGRSGTIQLMSSPTSPAFVDTGSVTPSGALPTAVGLVNLKVPGGTVLEDVEMGSGVGEYKNIYGSPGI